MCSFNYTSRTQGMSVDTANRKESLTQKDEHPASARIPLGDRTKETSKALIPHFEHRTPPPFPMNFPSTHIWFCDTIQCPAARHPLCREEASPQPSTASWLSQSVSPSPGTLKAGETSLVDFALVFPHALALRALGEQEGSPGTEVTDAQGAQMDGLLKEEPKGMLCKCRISPHLVPTILG